MRTAFAAKQPTSTAASKNKDSDIRALRIPRPARVPRPAADSVTAQEQYEELKTMDLTDIAAQVLVASKPPPIPVATQRAAAEAPANDVGPAALRAKPLLRVVAAYGWLVALFVAFAARAAFAALRRSGAACWIEAKERAGERFPELRAASRRSD